MKLFCAFVISALVGGTGLSAFAGPEEHKDLQVCYGVVAKGDLPESVPHQVCLESLDLDLNRNTISVYSYFNPYYFEALKLTNLIRNDEDHYKFSASAVLMSEERLCGPGELTLLKINGKTDFNGVASRQDLEELKITVVHEVTNDNCHSHPQTETYNYQLN